MWPVPAVLDGRDTNISTIIESSVAPASVHFHLDILQPLPSLVMWPALSVFVELSLDTGPLHRLIFIRNVLCLLH